MHTIERRWIESEDEYGEVCALRDRAYRDAGKLAPGESLSRREELRDPEARILALYVRGTLAGSAVVRVPGARSRLESVDVPLGRYPRELPPKTDVIEVSKLCLDPAFHGTGLSRAAFEEVHRALVAAGRSWIVIASDGKLVPRYLRLAFRRTGIRYPRPGGAEGDLELLVTRQKRFGLYGLHVGPLRWNVYLREVSRRLLAEDAYPRRRWLQHRLFAVYSAFAPLADWVAVRLVARRAALRSGMRPALP